LKITQIYPNENLDGPYTFRYKKNEKFERPCYIILGFESGVFVVFCPEILIGDAKYSKEWNLAKPLQDNSCSFVAFGKKNYLN
jgi:hypothetical protein